MYDNILVPIAFDNAHDSTGPIKIAKLLANPDAAITLLHVVEEIPAYVISYVPSDFLTEAHKATDAKLLELANAIPGGKAKVVQGHSGRTILDYAKDNGNDLIIIDSHRPGMQDLLLGSTATHVVRHAQCAVHVVR